MDSGCFAPFRSTFLLVFGQSFASTTFFWTLRRPQHLPYLNNQPPYPCSPCCRAFSHTSTSRTTTTCSPSPAPSHWKSHSLLHLVRCFAFLLRKPLTFWPPGRIPQSFLHHLSASLPSATPYQLPAHHFSLPSVLDLWSSWCTKFRLGTACTS